MRPAVCHRRRRFPGPWVRFPRRRVMQTQRLTVSGPAADLYLQMMESGAVVTNTRHGLQMIEPGHTTRTKVSPAQFATLERAGLVRRNETAPWVGAWRAVMQ